jgi:hypothetical protein
MMTHVEVGWAWIGEENITYENENAAKTAVLARFQDAVFEEWTECNESEASETEEVMWVIVKGEPKLALYQE